MYNYKLKITYKKKESETLYQEELLKVFNIHTFDTKILVEKIQILFNIFNKNFDDIFEIIKKKYKIPFILDNYSCFQILFSWENFFKMHFFLKIYFEKKTINKNIILNHLLNI